GCYREDGAASTARELARYRAAQLAARAAELLALWDEKTEPAADGASERIARRAEQRRQMWRDLLLFGEHTWGAATSVSDPDGEQTAAQWESKRRCLDRAAGAGRSRAAGDGEERVRPAGWSGLSQLVYVRGGAHSALWTDAAPDALRAAADLTLSQAELDSARRERLPGIGVRLLVERRL